MHLWSLSTHLTLPGAQMSQMAWEWRFVFFVAFPGWTVIEQSSLLVSGSYEPWAECTVWLVKGKTIIEQSLLRVTGRSWSQTIHSLSIPASSCTRGRRGPLEPLPRCHRAKAVWRLCLGFFLEELLIANLYFVLRHVLFCVPRLKKRRRSIQQLTLMAVALTKAFTYFVHRFLLCNLNISGQCWSFWHCWCHCGSASSHGGSGGNLWLTLFNQ